MYPLGTFSKTFQHFFVLQILLAYVLQLLNKVFFYLASFILLGPLGLSLSEIDKLKQVDPINSDQQEGRGEGVSTI